MTIARNQKGTCPHCKTPNRFEDVKYRQGGGIGNFQGERIENFPNWDLINGSEDKTKLLQTCRCTACGEIIIFFGEQMVYPIGAKRNYAPKEVPTEIGQDFNEACLVESLSSKASAALARRCLQNMLHEQKIAKANLSQEIDEAMKNLPSHLNEAIDAIRNIGNFAAHPMKSTNSGDSIDVEEGETEWILDALEQLFDFYYVQPAITKAKRAALDVKLQSIGKPLSK